jgi:D-alanyl-D-alanine carboxypeptidase/D-alanyl-D-alanine-endopeptidase (penicillin-binding protein 4)
MLKQAHICVGYSFFWKVRYVVALFVFILLLPNQVLAQVVPQDSIKNSIQKAIEKLAADADLINASVSFMVKDLKTGKEVSYYNPDMSLVPASVLKTVTTATALEVLGGGYTFKTELQYSGYIDTHCVLHGDVYIKGGGDPALGSRFFTQHYFEPFFMDIWADAIVQLGIDSINGRVIADDLLFGVEPTPSTWTYGDLGNYFGASPCALSIYDNTCFLTFSTSANAGDSAVLQCVDPYVPEMEFLNFVKGANVFDDFSTITGAMYDDYRVITGSLPKSKDEYEVRGSLPDPARQAAFELTMALNRKNVRLKTNYTTTRQLLHEKQNTKSERTSFYTMHSPSVSSIVYWTNLVSMNLFAEHLLYGVSLAKTGLANAESGSAAVINFWAKKGINTKGMYMHDGSGLSRYNAVSARHLTDIFKYMAVNSKYGKTFEGSLPVAGKSGTLSRICRKTAAEGRVMAKSGTIQRVKTFAGYVKTISGKKLAFALLVNNFNCSTAEMVKKIEKVFVAMSTYVN